MKRETNNKRNWIVLNALFLVLAVVIAINLYVTGGAPAKSAEAAALPAEASAFPAEAQESASSAAETPALPEETPEPEATPEPKAEVKTGTQDFSMRFVGDLMCCDYQMADALQADGTYDFTKHFAQIKNELQGADVLLGNFEACMYSGAPLNGTIVGFNAPLDYAKALKDCNFDVLFTSNNHAMDFLVPGAFETTQKLRDAGFVALGTNLTKEDVGSVYIRDVRGVPVAILAYTARTNKYKLELDGEDASWVMNYYSAERVAADVKTARELGAKVIVMYLHEGTEKDTEPDRRQLAAANESFAAGVDAVIMSHTHSLQKMEKRMVTVDGVEKPVFVAYSLGNFMSSAIHSESLNNIILNLDFTYDWDQDRLTSIDASYVLTYTYNYYNDQKIMSFSIVPLEQALADFSMVDSRTRYKQDRFQSAYDKIMKRIGVDAAEDVFTFHPDSVHTPAPTAEQTPVAGSSPTP
jgi:poly-gamma-glutamate synthesis protein (capsule biosynthesis protein)